MREPAQARRCGEWRGPFVATDQQQLGFAAIGWPCIINYWNSNFRATTTMMKPPPFDARLLNNI
jgi:hypothetical protein